MESFHAPSHPDEETRLRHERAWAAGFFDGEGWAAAVKNRDGKQPMAQIPQSSKNGIPEVLLRFRAAVGGTGTIRGPYLENGYEQRYQWSISSRGGVRRVFEAIGPWLSAPKRAQFISALGAITTGHGDRQGVDAAQATPEEELAWTAGLFDGEGSTWLERHRSHAGYFVVVAGVTQSSSDGIPEVLRRLDTALAIDGATYGPFKSRHARKLVYRWKVFGAEKAELLLGRLSPWLGVIKRRQALDALGVIRAQAPLPRGNPSWGAYKTHCIHGHEYATARIRTYRSRRGGTQRRDSKQCLVCTREQASARRAAKRDQRPFSK